MGSGHEVLSAWLAPVMDGARQGLCGCACSMEVPAGVLVTGGGEMWGSMF